MIAADHDQAARVDPITRARPGRSSQVIAGDLDPGTELITIAADLDPDLI
jgi:hypothetical protein